MKKLFAVILFFICVSAKAQDSTAVDSTDYKKYTALYVKMKKDYTLLLDELRRYEGKMQLLEIFIREEELKILNSKKSDN